MITRSTNLLNRIIDIEIEYHDIKIYMFSVILYRN